MTQLASVNSPITEEDAMAVLLKSMPDTYDTIVTTLKNLPNPSLAASSVHFKKKKESTIMPMKK